MANSASWPPKARPPWNVSRFNRQPSSDTCQASNLKAVSNNHVSHGHVAGEPFIKQLSMLALIAVVITIGVYGLAGIVAGALVLAVASAHSRTHSLRKPC